MEILLSQIAALVQGNVVGDPNKLIRGVAPFETAHEDEITLAGQAKFLKKMDETRAGAVIVASGVEGFSHNLLQVDNPPVAFAQVMEFFHPPAVPEAVIDPRAVIGRDFVCGADVAIGPLAVVGDRVTLGDRVWLFPGVIIGNDVVIGDDTIIYPNVTVYSRCRIGQRVIIHAGTVIGSDGFGFAPNGDQYYKIPHTGSVQIDDDVEIGANNTIDRGTFGKTWVRRGVKTDNLVHIAHNVTVGENSVLVAQVGISGSVTIGKNAILAGQAGIAGHLRIGDRATVGPQCGVGKSVPDGAVVIGSPEMPHKKWFRLQRIVAQLPELKKRLEALEKKLQQMEQRNGKGF
ncbi:MAG: UDP-3-O-(3-hydroxymyristoyl)glucosamine N-acyltransferase [Desulfobacterales bacterium]|nr:MAG: UDP-3-O-(3-hydroxymyristoyl)glucosamine N-acyltransferase [Desulfobacterales bacterium]